PGRSCSSTCKALGKGRDRSRDFALSLAQNADRIRTVGRKRRAAASPRVSAMNEREIFDAALVLTHPDRRTAYLDRACAGAPALKGHIEGLLQAHEQMGSFLEAPAETADGPAGGERPGTVIGPYKLLEQIGEGGFGVVFLAEQTQPVRRKVALKV